MLESLHIQNFQKHKDSLLEFSPGVNAIVGLNQQGKSSIIRALNWLIFDELLGQDMIKWGAKKCTITAKFSDSEEITRIKSQTKNLYVVGKNQYNALRGRVPPEVEQITNLSKANIQLQLDRHFFFTTTPGKRSAWINKVAGLDDIDETINNNNSNIKHTKSKMEECDERITSMEESLKEYELVDEMEEGLSEVEGLSEQCSNYSIAIDYLSDLISRHRNVKQKKKEIDSFLRSEKQFNLCLERIEKIKSMESKEYKLSSLIRRTSELYSRLKNEPKIEKADKEIEVVQKELKQYKKQEKMISRLESLIKSTIKYMKRNQEANEQINNLSEQMKELFQKETYCPLCGKEVDEETIQHVSEYI